MRAKIAYFRELLSMQADVFLFMFYYGTSWLVFVEVGSKSDYLASLKMDNIHSIYFLLKWILLKFAYSGNWKSLLYY